MATSNRATQVKKCIKAARKHYQPYAPPKDRSLLDHLLFACLLENSNHDAAERGFQTIQKEYFDLNEVRVSTVKELSESLRGLTDPSEAADRLKRTLHSVFEAVYAFDMEHLKKQNIGQSVKTIERLKGTTPFAVAFVTQNALGGHAIPVNNGLLIALEVVGVATETEVKKGIIPGLERAIPKSKGVEIASLLHQLGVEVGKNPYAASTRKLLLEIEPNCKDRLPKRPSKPVEAPPERAPGPPASKTPAAAAADDSKPAAKKPMAAKPAAKKPVDARRKAVKKTPKPTKKVVKKKSVTKKKTASRRLTQKKPR
jgi:endonuclease III